MVASNPVETLLSVEIDDIRNVAFEKLQTETTFDRVHVLSIENDSDWTMKSAYIQRALFDAGLIACPIMADPEKTALVAYTYPKEDKLGCGLFFTNNMVYGHMIVGLPGSATEQLNDRPYWGIVVYKNGEIYECYSYGNKLFESIEKPLEAMGEAEKRFVMRMLEYWEVK